MKKTLLVLSIVIIVLGGCTFFQKEEGVPTASPEESQLEKKIGVINSSQELNLTSPLSSFVLLAESGGQTFIDSLSVNLKKYKKRRVEVEGKWNESKTVFSVDNLTALGQETLVKQTYQDSDFGLKFKYPSIWILKEEKNVLGLNKISITPYETEEGENVDTITIEKSENNKKLSARQWLGLDEQYRLKTNTAGTSTIEEVYQESEIGVAQLTAVKKTLGLGEEVSFYVNRDTFMYKFTHTTINDSDKDTYKNAFFDIVASFEFVPFEKTAGTTTNTGAANTLMQPEPDTSLAKLAEEELAKRKLAEETRKQEEQAAAKSKSLTDTRQMFIDYIKTNISSLAPEAASMGGTWYAIKTTFAFPEGQPENFTAIYAEYEDGHDLRQILLNVPDRTKPELMTRAAYFKPGDATTWQLADGSDTSKESEKSIVDLIENPSGGEETVVKKGMSLLEARSFKIKIQYPANWYWAYVSDGYSFGNKPISGDNALVKLTKNPENLPPNMNVTEEADSKTFSQATSENLVTICIQVKDKYCAAGNAEYSDTIKTILSTIQE